jgi:hypothetical protein
LPVAVAQPAEQLVLQPFLAAEPPAGPGQSIQDMLVGVRLDRRSGLGLAVIAHVIAEPGKLPFDQQGIPASLHAAGQAIQRAMLLVEALPSSYSL